MCEQWKRWGGAAEINAGSLDGDKLRGELAILQTYLRKPAPLETKV